MDFFSSIRHQCKLIQDPLSFLFHWFPCIAPFLLCDSQKHVIWNMKFIHQSLLSIIHKIRVLVVSVSYCWCNQQHCLLKHVKQGWLAWRNYMEHFAIIVLHSMILFAFNCITVSHTCCLRRDCMNWQWYLSIYHGNVISN